MSGEFSYMHTRLPPPGRFSVGDARRRGTRAAAVSSAGGLRDRPGPVDERRREWCLPILAGQSGAGCRRNRRRARAIAIVQIGMLSNCRATRAGSNQYSGMRSACTGTFGKSRLVQARQAATISFEAL